MRRIELLVIEDNSADLFWLKSILEQIGLQHRLSVVGDGAKAVSFLRKQGEYANAPTPDLILLDINLPILNGIEVLREIPDAKGLPICIVSSSIAECELSGREFAITDSRYLIKPVTRDGLLRCFRCYPHLRPIAQELSRVFAQTPGNGRLF
jgi:two-component system, chemotaxis family, response regulator Rcp1